MAFELSVELTGKIDGLRDNFNAAIREVGKLDKDTKAKLASVDKGFADLADKIDQSIGKKAVQSTANASNSISKNLANIAASSNNMGGQVARSSNKAGLALTDLGRIAQDAPYGFIGIQNNLNPMLESFKRLKEETGSTGAALKSLAGSLIGPAGFGLAISLISSAILFYNQYQQKAAKETANSESAMKKAKKTADEYALSLDEVTRAGLVGSQNAARELVDLKTLYATTQNLTLSTKLRGKAVDEIQEKYPSYFKNIKDENILNGNSVGIYNALTVAILASSKARAAGDIMAENDKRNLTNVQKRNDLEVQYGQNLAKQAKLQNALKDSKQAGSAQFNARELAGLEEQRAVIAKQITDFKRDEEIITGRNLKLSGSILEYQKQGAELDGKVGGGGADKAAKKVKDVKDLSDVLAELQVELIQTDNSFGETFDDKSKDKIKSYQKAIDELIKMGYQPASKAIEDLKNAQKELFQLESLGKSPSIKVNPGNPLKVQGNNEKGGVNLKVFTDAELKAEQSKKNINDTLSNFIDTGIASAISSSFTDVGAALVEGGNLFTAAAKGMQDSFGELLKALGKQFITMGVAKMAAGALLSPFGWKEIGQGAALVALGAGLSVTGGAAGSIGKGGSSKQGNGKVTAFANGGIISGPTLGLMGEYAGARNNPEVVAPLNKLTSLMGIDEQGNKKNSNQQVIIGGDIVWKGEDAYISLKRVEKRLGRV